MSVLQGSAPRPRPASLWGLYLVGFLVIAGILARVAGRTANLALSAEQAAVRATEASLQATARATAVAVLFSTGTPLPPAALSGPTAEPTATLVPPTPTPTVIPGCELYNPSNDLLIRVDRNTELPREYEPDDLAAVPLNPKNAYYGPLLLRRAAHQPLLNLLEAMNASEDEFQVTVVSGYRSYSEQAVAYDKWLERYPDRASNISAVPGHSEHQTGTAVDFSTPYMEDLFGEQFHPQFFYTKEGEWLAKHAAMFGFVMSYPSWAVEQTGYEWEPWHYRYVGVELAQDLTRRETTVSQLIQTCSPAG